MPVPSPNSTAYTFQAAPWTAVIAVASAAFILVSSECLPIGLLPKMAKDLGVSEGLAGLTITLPGVVAAIAAPLTIGLMGRFDRRKVLWCLLGLLILSNLIVATATEFRLLLLGRALLGAGLGGFWTIATAIGSRLRPPHQAVRATSIIYSGISMGTVAGVPAGALLGDLLGWRLAFASCALMGALALIALITLLPTLKPEGGSGLSKVAEVLRLRKVQIGLTAIVLMLVGQFSAYTFIAPFLDQSVGIAGPGLSVFLLTYGVAGFFGNLLGGWLASRHLTGAIITAAAVMAIALTILMISKTPGMSWLSVILWGVSFGALPITTQLYVFSAAPEYKESIAALSVSIGQVSIGAGALSGGFAVDHLGVPSAILFGALSALAIALLVYSYERGAIRRWI